MFARAFHSGFAQTFLEIFFAHLFSLNCRSLQITEKTIVSRRSGSGRTVATGFILGNLWRGRVRSRMTYSERSVDRDLRENYRLTATAAVAKAMACQGAPWLQESVVLKLFVLPNDLFECTRFMC
jgi:hypothetical protein